MMVRDSSKQEVTEVIDLDPNNREGSVSEDRFALITAEIERSKLKSTMKIRRRTFLDDLVSSANDSEASISRFEELFSRHKAVCPLPRQYARSRENGLQSSSLLVDCLLYVEMLTGYLMGLQDADKIQGSQVRFISAKGGEVVHTYQGDVACGLGDKLVVDDEGVVASMLRGPDSRTNVDSETTSLAFFVFSAPALPVERMDRAVQFVADLLMEADSTPTVSIGYLR